MLASNKNACNGVGTHLLGQPQDGTVGGLVLKVGIVHGIPCICKGDAHSVRAVLQDCLLQRLEVA